MVELGSQKKKIKFKLLIYYIKIMHIKYSFATLVILLLIPLSKVNSNPIGKSLSCYPALKENLNFKNYKGIKFETEKSVRVVTLKMKNNKLKVVSKLTPYKINKKNIFFKIKFIWYGNIFFEEFKLNRENLNLINTSKNKVRQLRCDIIDGDFMVEMNSNKENYQRFYEQKVGKKNNKF